MSDNQQPKPPGTIGWNELVTRDVEGSVEFYSKLLGWTANEMPMPTGNYTIFNQGEEMVAGCMAPPPEAEGAPTMWMSYINVEDLDATVAKAKELGAKMCKERVDLPMGSFAIATDPQGAVIAFWQQAEGGGDCGN